MKKEHITVLLEEMNGKFSLVLEGHAALDRKIDALRTDIGERFATTDVKLDALNCKIDTVKAELTQRIDTVETNLTEHIMAVAADLKAHREDTEAHVSGYRVGEQSHRYEEGQKSQSSKPTNGAK
jgi:hypothetical protein